MTKYKMTCGNKECNNVYYTKSAPYGLFSVIAGYEPTCCPICNYCGGTVEYVNNTDELTHHRLMYDKIDKQVRRANIKTNLIKSLAIVGVLLTIMLILK